MTHSRHRRARAEQQRRRIVYLLEELADEEHLEQCPRCGEWFEQVSSHKPHCEA